MLLCVVVVQFCVVCGFVLCCNAVKDCTFVTACCFIGCAVVWFVCRAGHESVPVERKQRQHHTDVQGAEPGQHRHKRPVSAMCSRAVFVRVAAPSSALLVANNIVA